MSERQVQFEWDEAKALANLLKHGISFELAATVFRDPQLLTVADLEHSETEERWVSVGCANNGVALTIVYLWSDNESELVKIRMISARKATFKETCYYQEGHDPTFD